jgi:glycosyltransferase involved in cell wall biosynthesis
MVPWLSNISPLHTCHRKEKVILDPDDLAKQVDWIISHPAKLERMRQEARAEHEAKYKAERNYEMLMEIYEKAISQAHSRK